MGLLNNTSVYLAGPVERDSECGGWRNTITPLLKEIGIRIYNPLIKPQWFINECGCEVTPKQQRESKKILSDIAFEPSNVIPNDLVLNKYIRKVCLRLVSAADFVICKVSGPTVGTYEELAICNQQEKPILFLMDELDSCWRVAQFYNHSYEYREQLAFKTIDELIEILKDIDLGNYKNINPLKWIFLPQIGWTND